MSSIDSGTSGAPMRAALSTLSAFFDDQSAAEDAIRRLKDIGLADDQIRFMPGYEADSEVAHSDHNKFWDGLSGWLFPLEDRAAYAEGLRRGGFLVSVQVDDQSYESAHDILDDEGSIDMDERADLWRNDGWDGGHSALTSSKGELSPDTDRTTTQYAQDAALNRRDLEKSTPRVRSYRSP
ncbi:hypothetical protein JNB88_32645 [Rhizobium cauense]|uniref:hypothetical protein n=1 Tax=Rhizobium cauense TaxID=1166683 RepID=UPI001C6F0264|nr:hypothetical protein [Rhizobium cauense]